MKIIYTTIGVELEEVLNLSIDYKSVYNIGNLIDMFPTSIGQYGYDKLDLVSRYINSSIDNNETIIIQGAFDDINQYKKLKKLIRQPVERVYIKFSNTVEKYKEEWGELSNWVDTVEHHAAREKAWNDEVRKLEKVLKSEGVEVVSLG